MIPVIVHNVREYDGQIIIKHITKDFADIANFCKLCKHCSLSYLSEKFISFQTGNLRFLDSLQFLSASLDTLVQTLIKDRTHKFPNTKLHYPNSDLAFQKGTYPYEFMDGPEKFKRERTPLVKSSTAA